ncbi:branched-chain amino acid ABC transporter permease [Natrinema salsiterrestre]|uniref:Branched-chain amino acid ABC transporter permease n=1 Tax=Natrinema salsiterrestre TaxID=2950540 RepID=A0A9Q4L8C1_9EURY|nr:branched-chain amino acid ABC transporter permease [Natrinema salsiterrestre]MDF9747830.1 branched-chain amino acid ABC transporter permease [Natrinema salsiterrestre]
MISDIITILIVGAMISAIYALIAIGFTMIFGVGGILNLTHGALLMIAAYAYFVTQPYIGRAGGVIVGIVLAAVASYGVYMGLVRYIEENVVITFMATIMAALALQEAMTMAFSQQAQVLTPIMPGSVAIAGTRMQYDQLLAFVFSWVMIGMLWYYVTNTKDGRAILATSMSERGAIFTGVDLPRVRRQTWLIAGAFAGVGGIFIGRLQQTSPEMWLEPLTLAFMIVIIGGVGSIKGSIIAAYLIGYIETLTVALLGAPYRVVVALLIIIAVIMYRPEGLYGREYLE